VIEVREVSGGGHGTDQTHLRTAAPSIFWFPIWSGVEPSPLLLWPLIGLLHLPSMTDGDDCGGISGVNEWQGNRSTTKKPSPVPLCPLQVQHYLTRARTWTSAVGSRRVTASGTARSHRQLL
jgi:hypothetical protein